MLRSIEFPKSNGWLVEHVNNYLAATAQSERVESEGSCLGMTGIWATYFVNGELEQYLVTMENFYSYNFQENVEKEQWIDDLVKAYIAYQEPFLLKDDHETIGYFFPNQSPIRATEYLRAKKNSRGINCCSAGMSHVIASSRDFERYLNAFIRVSVEVSGYVAFIIQGVDHAIGLGFHQGFWHVMNGVDAEPQANLSAKDAADLIFKTFDKEYDVKQDYNEMLMSVRVFTAENQQQELKAVMNRWSGSKIYKILSSVNERSVNFVEKQSGFDLLDLAILESNANLFLKIKEFYPTIGTGDRLKRALAYSSMEMIEAIIKCNIGSIYQLGFEEIIKYVLERRNGAAILSLILFYAKQEKGYGEAWNAAEQNIRDAKNTELISVYIKNRPVVESPSMSLISASIFSSRPVGEGPPKKKLCLPKPVTIPTLK